MNRTRERDFGTNSLKLRDLVNGYQADRLETNKDRCTDTFPVGSFQAGEYKTSEVLLEKVRQSFGPCEFFWYNYPKDTQYQGHATGYFVSGYQVDHNGDYWATPSADPVRTQRLLQRSYSKIKADDLGLAESLGEYADVLRMFVSPVKGMSKLLRKAIFKRPGVLRSVRGASDAWLEYRYGWMPLYQTVADYRTNLPRFKNGIRTFSESEVVESSIAPAPAMRRVFGSSNGMAVHSAGCKSTRIRYTVRHYVNISDADAFNKYKVGGSIFSAPALAWEFVPLSFVLDWWWNFGDYLKNICPMMGANVLGATYSACVHEEVTNWVYATGFINWPYTRPASANMHSVKSTYYRVPITPYRPGLPSVDYLYHNVKHVADSLSLITSRTLPKRGKLWP